MNDCTATPGVLLVEGLRQTEAPPLTLADYDEAIRNLKDVREQLANGDPAFGCGYCGSETHQPSSCPHNPLELARRVDERPPLWRCYHCCETFAATDLIAARAHFGLTYTAMPECVTEALVRAGIVFELTTDENGQPAFALRLESAEVAS